MNLMEWEVGIPGKPKVSCIFFSRLHYASIHQRVWGPFFVLVFWYFFSDLAYLSEFLRQPGRMEYSNYS
jgi:hypothetical protein